MGSLRFSVAAALVIGVFTSSCASRPLTGRSPAQIGTPLTHEQVIKIEEVGIRILAITVLSNSVQKDAKVSADLAKEIERIKLDAGMYGPTSAGMSMLVMVGIGAGAISSAPAEKASLQGLGLIVIGVGMLASAEGSTRVSRSSSKNNEYLLWNSKGGSAEIDQAKVEAQKKNQANAKIFDAQMKRVTALYSEIFSLDNIQTLQLERILRLSVIEEGKRKASSEEIVINVPRMMEEEGLISSALHENYLEIADSVQKASRTDAAINRVLDGKQFERNLRMAKNQLYVYITWLKGAKEGLELTDKRRVESEISRSERLLARI